MKVSNLANLIKASPIALFVISIFYPPVLFIWAAGAAFLAAVVVYPDELRTAANEVVTRIPLAIQGIIEYALQPPKEALFILLMVVFLFVLAPIILLGFAYYAGEPWPDLEADEPPEL